MDLCVLFGGVTGNSESIAYLIGSQAEAKLDIFKSVRTHCLKNSTNYRKSLLAKDSITVIVSSTTGDGEQPEEVLPFVKWIDSISDLSCFRNEIFAWRTF